MSLAKNNADRGCTLPAFATMRAFEAVGRLSGVRRAAKALNLDHAVVSRHVRALEEWAGVRLIDRVEGRLCLSPDGARYHARISAALAELTDASNELLRCNEDHQLRIACVPGFASQWLASHLRQFQAANPQIDLELHPTDSSPDFSRYEADIDIRYVAGSEAISCATTSSGVRSFEIARPAVYPVASPECVAELTATRTPADLLQAPLLHMANHQQWRSWFSEHGVAAPDVLRGPRLWHAHLAVEAARRGQGVALANSFLVGDDLATGRLMQLPADSDCGIALGAYVFSARADRWRVPAVVQFRRWLRGAATAQAA